MEVEFTRRADGGSVAEIARVDGVRLRMRSYDVTNQVPHDAIHLIGERALGMSDGLFGSIAAGAVFESMEVVGGRQRHDRRQRSEEIRRRHAGSLRLAETLVGALQGSLDADAAGAKDRLDAAWGITRTGASPFSAEQADRAVRELRRLRTEWAGLAVGGPGVRYTWPEPAGRRRPRGSN
ncbi:hypothetical protein [Actinomycetospora termitidis]|uniref:Uncharacterized protein n=1 Tax=Actinomycetospora termitidis TaxID=3053470 RepID=A0ABT7M4K2_9PSEU|nr:hypothetical protein [Actinomycetospora sp. Odt1-22]MDL5154962.1 hypothetical protein [Actinomycetospora sp. Odt1-22]